jgi:hypothetical protein
MRRKCPDALVRHVRHVLRDGLRALGDGSGVFCCAWHGKSEANSFSVGDYS